MPTPDTAALLGDAAARAARYLDGLGERAVAPAAAAVEALSALDTPLPDAPADAAAVLAELDELVGPATMATAGPRFFGFVIGGALPATVAANVLATAWDQNSARSDVTPGTARVEAVALRWILDALGLPAGTSGGFVTGATLANFTALAAARHALLAREGWNVEERGLFGAPDVEVVYGGEAHPSLIKAISMLGLGKSRVTIVPADDQGRMHADGLRRLAARTIVCLQAGNVNTGSFDPFETLVPRARAAAAWVHVDGAFGLWARAAPSRAALARGIEGADSWATDLHKWLNVPYDSGLALVRDEAAVRSAMGMTAAYLPEGTQRDPAEYTPELSRRARGLEAWAALRALGRSGLAELVERNCRQARRFAEGLGAAGYRVLNDVVLNQVVVSFGDADRTRRVIAAIQRDGTCWCGGTIWQGHVAMRISVSSWATTDADVERSLEAMIRVARGVKVQAAAGVSPADDPRIENQMAKTDFKSVDQYIASQPERGQKVLKRVRGILRKAVPRAEEVISYQIPAYKLNGRPVVFFAGWKEHYSLYPATEKVVAALKDDLAPYEVQKGTIRFPISEPVPVDLIARIAQLRAEEAAENREIRPSSATGRKAKAARGEGGAKAKAAPKTGRPGAKGSPARKTASRPKTRRPRAY